MRQLVTFLVILSAVVIAGKISDIAPTTPAADDRFPFSGPDDGDPPATATVADIFERLGLIRSVRTFSSQSDLEAAVTYANANPDETVGARFGASPIAIASDVTLPENIVLDSDWGEFRVAAGATLTIDGPVLDHGHRAIFLDEDGDPPDPRDDAKLRYEGTFGYHDIRPEWFGAVGDQVVDDTSSVLSALYTSGPRIRLDQLYSVTRPLPMTGKRVIGRHPLGSGIRADNSANTFDPAWDTAGGTRYLDPDVVQHGGAYYACKATHVSGGTGAVDEPGVGGSWSTYWQTVPGPFLIRIGNWTSSYSGSYSFHSENLYLKLSDAVGVMGFYCAGTVGEHTTILGTTISALGAWLGVTNYGIYVDDYTQNMTIDNLWITSKGSSAVGGYDSGYTVGVRMPRGRSNSITNFSIASNVCIETDADGSHIRVGHCEGANGLGDTPAKGIRVLSRGGTGQENARATLTIQDVNFRGCFGGNIVNEDDEAHLTILDCLGLNAEHRAKAVAEWENDTLTLTCDTYHLQTVGSSQSLNLKGFVGSVDINGPRSGISAPTSTTLQFSLPGGPSPAEVFTGDYDSGTRGLVGEPEAYRAPMVRDEGFYPVRTTDNDEDPSLSSTNIAFYSRRGSSYRDFLTNDPNLKGDGFYEDLPATLMLRGASDPTFTKICDDGSGSTGVFLPVFATAATNEMLIFPGAELPDSWDGSAVYPHVHWMPTTTDAGTVYWDLELAFQGMGGEYLSSSLVRIEQETQGFAHQHLMEGSAAIAVPDSRTACIVGRISRAGTADSYSAGAALLKLDFHFRRYDGRIGILPGYAGWVPPLDGVSGQVYGWSMRPLVTGGAVGTSASWADQLGAEDLTASGTTPPVRSAESWDAGASDGTLLGNSIDLDGEHWFFMVAHAEALQQWGQFDAGAANTQHWGVKITDAGKAGFYHRYNSSNWAYWTTADGAVQEESVVVIRYPADQASAAQIWINGVEQDVDQTSAGDHLLYKGDLISVASKYLTIGYGSVAAGTPAAAPGPYKEMFILSGDHSDDRSAIERNMMTYYGIDY